jgi:2-polyprenyl-6-hydroxyphenyl methylase/3-demethylubiquinone-9 3-methyltransferase
VRAPGAARRDRCRRRSRAGDPAVARRHAQETGVEVDYRCIAAEALAEEGETFDLVLALEVIEHVADSDLFLQACAKLARPGGLVILSTLNRTIKSFAFAIVMAEYVLRLLPRGAHQWGRFLTPNEVSATLGQNGFRLLDLSGVTLNLRSRALQLSTNTDVNYMLAACRMEDGDEAPGTESIR